MTTIKTETSEPATRSKAAPRKKKKTMRLRFKLPPRWKRYAFFGIGVPMILLSFAMAYYWVVFSKMIDARMSGEMARTDPRVFARPFELHRGQALTERQLVDRLNDLGYAHRARAEQPGEFTVGREAMVLIPRDGDHKGRTVRLVFGGRPAKTAEPARIETIELPPDKKAVERITLDPPLITALVTSEAREKRRDVPLQAIPRQMIQAVLAIEDRRFYDHPGIDPIGIAGAVFRNVFGNKAYLASGSTVTQQLVKNTFLTPDKTPKRKMIEWFMSVVLETRLTKDQILQLYLNDVSLGQRGSFAIHGVAEAARLFFAKDISNVSVAEAATIAGVIQSPSRLSPFNNPERAKERRNVVIRAMADTGFISGESADRAVREPLQIVARALEAEAPYFVDYVSQELQAKYPAAGAVDVYTTLDVHLQRIAQDSLREGIIRLDEMLARRKRQPQAALIAIDPRTGEVLAFVGGRSYNQSQYNRVVSARRQPGSVFKPFVYLAAFEHAQAEGRTDLTPATVDHRRAHVVRLQRADVDAAQLRRRIRRPDHAAPRPGAVAQHRRGEGRRVGGLRRSRGAVAPRRRRHAAAAVPGDRARRVRGHAVRDRHRLHAVPERRHDPPADGHLAARRQGQGPAAQEPPSRARWRGPTPPSSSRT